MDHFLYNIGKDVQRVYFCGLCGISMLSLALITKANGYAVMGSDTDPSDRAIKLCRENGIPLFFSHEKENIEGCDTFVYTHAISESNPELLAAKKLGLAVYTRSQYLELIERCHARSIAVAGSHGKSTSTGLLRRLFKSCGSNPTVLCGATDAESGNAFEIGKSGDLIYEACEYRRAFLDFHPSLAIILNIEKEHTDIYPDIKAAEDAFFNFAKQSGAVILNGDCPSCINVKKRLGEIGKKTYTFSTESKNAYAYAENIRPQKGRCIFDLIIKDRDPIKNIHLAVFGAHNVKNAIAGAIAAVLSLDASNENIKRGIEIFKGIKGRMEHLGNVNGADIYDDYAHHPTEIKASLKTAKAMGYRKILCIFQPHTYSRTHDLFDEFCESFSDASEVIFADIFPAREKNIYGISSYMLAQKTPNALYLPSLGQILRYAENNCKEGTLILTMGAGRMRQIGISLCEKYQI